MTLHRASVIGLIVIFTAAAILISLAVSEKPRPYVWQSRTVKTLVIDPDRELEVQEGWK